MTSTAIQALESTARDLLVREWHQWALAHAHTVSSSGGEADSPCPILWMLPDLLDLVAETHDQPVQCLAALIHRHVAEPNFVDDNGDSLPLDPSDLDEQTEMLVRVLEEVRQAAIKDGQWSSTPATPIMCG